MAWTDLCDNTDAISRRFTSPPPLERVLITDWSLLQGGPGLHVGVRLAVRPDKEPYSADATVTSTDILFHFWPVRKVCIDGWGEQIEGSLSFGRHGSGGIEFSFHSTDCSFSGVCDTVMLSAVSCFSESIAKQRKIRLFSHRNVFNSCILLAISKGFSVLLTGGPDPNDEPSLCGWRAKKGDVELDGDNPIELAGLIALYEHHRPTKAKDYWWRIEGPDVLDEVRKKWEAKHFGPFIRDEDG
jgi:hypothetical protein